MRLDNRRPNGKSAESRGAKLAKSGMQQIENRIRHTVRTIAEHLPMSAHPEENERDTPARKGRTGIVSINGQDVCKLHCTGRIKNA